MAQYGTRTTLRIAGTLLAAVLLTLPGRAAGETSTQTASDQVRNGYRHLEGGGLEDALGAFGQALRSQPRNVAALTGRGMVLARQGRLREAEETLRAALVLNPDPAPTLYELGQVYLRLGEPGRAVAAFKEGIAHRSKGRSPLHRTPAREIWPQ